MRCLTYIRYVPSVFLKKRFLSIGFPAAAAGSRTSLESMTFAEDSVCGRFSEVSIYSVSSSACWSYLEGPVEAAVDMRVEGMAMALGCGLSYLVIVCCSFLP